MERTKTHQSKNRKVKEKREIGNPPKPKKQDTGNPPKIGNPPKKEDKGGHRKSPKTNEPRPEKRLAPPKIAQKSDSTRFQDTRRERARAGEREAGKNYN